MKKVISIILAIMSIISVFSFATAAQAQTKTNVVKECYQGYDYMWYYFVVKYEVPGKDLKCVELETYNGSKYVSTGISSTKKKGKLTLKQICNSTVVHYRLRIDYWNKNKTKSHYKGYGSITIRPDTVSFPLFSKINHGKVKLSNNTPHEIFYNNNVYYEVATDKKFKKIVLKKHTEVHDNSFTIDGKKLKKNKEYYIRAKYYENAKYSIPNKKGMKECKIYSSEFSKTKSFSF